MRKTLVEHGWRRDCAIDPGHAVPASEPDIVQIFFVARPASVVQANLFRVRSLRQVPGCARDAG